MSSVKSNVILFQFSDPPKVVSFISSKANGIAVVGEAVEFTYNTTSLPLASYELRHNSVLIRNSTNQVYKIANASLADEGMYRCVAYNYVGYSAMSSVNLTIHGKIYILIICTRMCVELLSMSICAHAREFYRGTYERGKREQALLLSFL